MFSETLLSIHVRYLRNHHLLGHFLQACQLIEEFKKRNVKALGLSCDSVAAHLDWSKDIENLYPDTKVLIPMIGDEDRTVAKVITTWSLV